MVAWHFTIKIGSEDFHGLVTFASIQINLKDTGSQRSLDDMQHSKITLIQHCYPSFTLHLQLSWLYSSIYITEAYVLSFVQRILLRITNDISSNLMPGFHPECNIDPLSTLHQLFYYNTKLHDGGGIARHLDITRASMALHTGFHTNVVRKNTTKPNIYHRQVYGSEGCIDYGIHCTLLVIIHHGPFYNMHLLP